MSIVGQGSPGGDMAREFDLILYGATGFTGRQAAAYLASRADPGLRWAVAGRDREKLTALGSSAPILVAATDRPAELDAMAARARVVLTMAGPFKRYGDPIVAACLRAGTDYCDISGETARIRGLIDRHNADAVEQRVRIVNFCGASSVPADLAVHLLDQRLGGRLVEAKAAVSIRGGSFNGGTIASIADAIESGDAAREADPFLLGPAGRVPTPIEQDPTGLRFDPDLGAWMTPSPMGRSDTRAIRRSAALTGRDIVFQEYMGFGGAGAWRRAAGTVALLRGLDLAFGWTPTRRLLQRMTAPGQGPSEERMDAASYALRVWGRGAEGSTAHALIADAGDPANRVTVKCACESALALALEPEALPSRFGVLTPAVAMGDVLVRRLVAAGMTLDVR